MNRKRTLVLVSAILVIEAALILALPARIPRPARAVTAGINLIAVAGLWLFARQNRKNP